MHACMQSSALSVSFSDPAHDNDDAVCTAMHACMRKACASLARTISAGETGGWGAAGAAGAAAVVPGAPGVAPVVQPRAAAQAACAQGGARADDPRERGRRAHTAGGCVYDPSAAAGRAAQPPGAWCFLLIHVHAGCDRFLCRDLPNGPPSHACVGLPSASEHCPVEPPSCASTPLLHAQQVLDTCAAPGSKTAQILEMLHHGAAGTPPGQQ